MGHALIDAEAAHEALATRVAELEREVTDAAKLLTLVGLKEHVAKAVAAEREACAKVAEEWIAGSPTMQAIAAAIRTRGDR